MKNVTRVYLLQKRTIQVLTDSGLTKEGIASKVVIFVVKEITMLVVITLIMLATTCTVTITSNSMALVTIEVVCLLECMVQAGVGNRP